VLRSLHIIAKHKRPGILGFISILVSLQRMNGHAQESKSSNYVRLKGDVSTITDRAFLTHAMRAGLSAALIDSLHQRNKELTEP